MIGASIEVAEGDEVDGGDCENETSERLPSKNLGRTYGDVNAKKFTVDAKPSTVNAKPSTVDARGFEYLTSDATIFSSCNTRLPKHLFFNTLTRNGTSE